MLVRDLSDDHIDLMEEPWGSAFQVFLPWNTIGARTSLSSVFRNGGSRELQAEAWVACMSSKTFSLETSDDDDDDDADGDTGTDKLAL